MQVAPLELRGAWAFVERNFQATKRYWGWEVVFLVYSVVNVLAVTYIAPGAQALTGVATTTEFMVLYLLIGTLVWTYLNGVFDSVAYMVSWERWEGTIEYTFMAPIRMITMLFGSSAFSIVYGALRTAIVAGASLLFFDLDLGRADLGTAAVFVALGSVGLLGVGIMASSLPLLFLERGTQMVVVVQAILLLISGIYYPIEVLPDWLEPFSRISPATYILQGIRAALLDGTPLSELGGLIWPLLVISILSIPLGIVVFQGSVNYAKRTGRLKRSG